MVVAETKPSTYKTCIGSIDHREARTRICKDGKGNCRDVTLPPVYYTFQRFLSSAVKAVSLHPKMNKILIMSLELLYIFTSWQAYNAEYS